MPSNADLKRSYFLKMLGLTSSSLSNADLEALYASANVNEPASLPMDSGYYYGPYGGGVTSAAGANGRLALTPFFIPSSVSINGFAFETTVVAAPAGAAFTPCVFNDDKGWPSAPIAVGPATDVTVVAINQVVLSPAVTLPRGWYWLGGLLLGATTTVPNLRMCNGDSIGYATAAASLATGLLTNSFGTIASGLSSMPGTYPTAKGTPTSGSIPRVFIKTV